MREITQAPPLVKTPPPSHPPTQKADKHPAKPPARQTQVRQGSDVRFKKVPTQQGLRRSRPEEMKKQNTVTNVQQAFSNSSSRIRSQSSSQGLPASALQKAYNFEKCRWSTCYAEDEDFKAKVDVYHDQRTKLIRAIAAHEIAPAEIDTRSMELGRQLAVIYGQISESGSWDPDADSRIKAGGRDYANWSIYANYLQQTPGIVRSLCLLTVNIGLAAAAIELSHSTTMQYTLAAINGAAVAAQIFTFYRVPLWQSKGQSIDVALRNQHGPEYQANLSPSVLILEDTGTGKLQGTNFLERRIDFLKSCKGTMGYAILSHLRALKTQYEDLEDQIAQVQVQDAERLSRADARTYHKHKKITDQLVALDKEIKFLAGLARRPDTDEGIDAEVEKLENELAAERIYVKLSYQLNQGWSKNWRNAFNAAGAAVGLVANYLGASGWGSVGLQGGTLLTQISQVFGYHFFHRRKAGQDYKSLLTVQFQLAALTGVGNLAPKDNNFNPKRLDQVVVGPLQRRVTHFKNVLEFDRTVYRAAFLSALSDAGGNMPNGSYQRSVLFFSECKTLAARQLYLDKARTYSSVSSEGAKKAQAILTLYEENEANIKLLDEGRLDAVLSDQSKLPDTSKTVLKGALLCAQSHGNEHEAEDDALAVWKGWTESLSDLASVNQAAQKEGQNFLLWGAGPAAPLAFKLITNAIQAFYYGVSPLDYGQRKTIINIVGSVGNVASILGAIVGYFIAYSAHENISTKEIHRGRDRERGAAMPNAGILDFSLLSALFDDHKPTGFETLAAKQIPDEDRPEPVGYDRKATLLLDAKEQIMAPAFLTMCKYLDLEPSQFNVQTLDEAADLRDAYARKLQAYALEMEAADTLDNKPVAGNKKRGSKKLTPSARVSFAKDTIIEIEPRLKRPTQPPQRIRKGKEPIAPRFVVPALQFPQRQGSTSDGSKPSTGRRSGVSFAKPAGLDPRREFSRRTISRTRFSRVDASAEEPPLPTDRGEILGTPRGTGATASINRLVDFVRAHDDDDIIEVKRFLVGRNFVDDEEEDSIDEIFRDMTSVFDDDVKDQEDQFYVDLFHSDIATSGTTPRSTSPTPRSTSPTPRAPNLPIYSDNDSSAESEQEKGSTQTVSSGSDSSVQSESEHENNRLSDEESGSSVESIDYRTNILVQLGQQYDALLVPDLPAVFTDAKRPVWHNLGQLHANIGNPLFVQDLSYQELKDCQDLALNIVLDVDTNDMANRNVSEVLKAINKEVARRAAAQTKQ